ncbi:hypothetical protein [Streptomyces sp. NPDC023588]|uniref:hypothetical protein n=1 Tax=Streptomyces sp. NPDC023588 TaxID=3154907 RepID=UPI0033CFD417
MDVRRAPAGRSSFALVVVANVWVGSACAGLVSPTGAVRPVWVTYIVEPAVEFPTGTVTVPSVVQGWLSVLKVQVPVTFLPTAAKSPHP